MNSEGCLTGKIAVVTGATSGSGRAIAKRFVAEGASVCLLARGVERVQELEAELEPHAVGIPADVGDPGSVAAAFDQIRERFSKLDILVNNAAVYRPCPVEKLSDEEILAQVNTNFLGPVYTCRAAIPLMKAAGGGDIVNTSSESTIEAFPLLSIYASTKAALETFGKLLRAEVRADGIRVTTLIQGVAPGEGGGSTGWAWDPEHAARAHEIWQAEGVYGRIQGVDRGQSVADVAEVHLFIVTRPRGQILDVVRCRND
jgi:NAD(P)-dependent dehydrogenase (short-subunit alcohol dehydrogenase family)